MSHVTDSHINAVHTWHVIIHNGVQQGDPLYSLLFTPLSAVFQFHKAEDKDQLRNAIENYQANLRKGVNAKNLKKFCDAFLK